MGRKGLKYRNKGHQIRDILPALVILYRHIVLHYFYISVFFGSRLNKLYINKSFTYILDVHNQHLPVLISQFMVLNSHTPMVI